MIFEALCLEVLPIYRIDYAPPTLVGIGAGEFLFFIGVFSLWFIVGLFFDRRGSSQMHRQTTIWRVLWTLLLLAFGH
jgi:hypothetical protein